MNLHIITTFLPYLKLGKIFLFITMPMLPTSNLRNFYLSSKKQTIITLYQYQFWIFRLKMSSPYPIVATGVNFVKFYVTNRCFFFVLFSITVCPKRNKPVVANLPTIMKPKYCKFSK